MRKLTIAGLLFCLLIAAACGGAKSPDAVTKGVTFSATKAAPGPTTYSTPVPTKTSAGQEWAPIDTPDRLIVRNGSITMLVDDMPAALDGVSRVAEGVSGYVVSSQSWRNGERNFGSISIRVPVASFEGVMRSIVALAVEVTNQSTSSQDVTAEYVDLTARLKNLEATERQLLTIMERAVQIDDVLAVQRELTTVRGDIEAVKGRMAYLETTSAMSLINVSLEQSSLGLEIKADRAVVNQGENIYFSADIFGGFPPYSYEWDFGDGGKSTIADPDHAYKKPGIYDVSLRVTDDRGNTYNETRTEYINVLASGWNLGRVFEGAWNALLTFGKGLISLIAVLLVFSPVWLTLVIVLVIRNRRKARR
jgi:PKD repeat protein